MYLKKGFKSVKNKCKWLKIDNESQNTKGIGFEILDELMIKKVGKIDWSEGDLDFLGYLF